MNIKDAAAIILVKDDKIFLAQRNPLLKFLGGYHAFPGGKLDETDSLADVRNCEDIEIKRLIACAVRETFEEVGVLLVRNGDKMTKGQRASLLDDLNSGRSTFAEILTHWGLWIDARDFRYTGFWTTPNFSPVRFKTRFFIAKCPEKQEPTTFGELVAGEFLTPKEALNLWKTNEILISPPVLISLQELAKTDDLLSESVSKRLVHKSETCVGNIDFIELNSRLILLPLKTPTLPPATHTNCFIVGKKEFIVIDAASADATEQAKLHKLIDELIEKGNVCQEIVVSHLHSDHHGGEVALQKHLAEKHGLNVPIATHKLTAESLSHIKFDRFIEDNEGFNLKDENGEPFYLQALHTRGHARGMFAFYDEERGFLLPSDNVVGLGSVVIAPPEGNMSDYMLTLSRLLNLPNLKFLAGSHGPAIYDGIGKIKQYISHRKHREQQILHAYNEGAKTASEIVEIVYVDLKPELTRLAVKSVEAHLENLKISNQIL